MSFQDKIVAGQLPLNVDGVTYSPRFVCGWRNYVARQQNKPNPVLRLALTGAASFGSLGRTILLKLPGGLWVVSEVGCFTGLWGSGLCTITVNLSAEPH
jgi:hypothetical protein